MPQIISRAQARSNADALRRLAGGPTRRHQGSRKARHTAMDATVYEALVSHHHWASGRCNPGYRAIARLAGAALSTVSAAIHRLKAAGFIKVKRHLIWVPGHGLRWAHSYVLIPVPTPEKVPEAPRSAFSTEPDSIKKNSLRRRPFRHMGPQEPARTVEEQLRILALPYPYTEEQRLDPVTDR